MIPLVRIFLVFTLCHASHIVFIGDSLMRYSYLEFVYHFHFHDYPPQNFTFNENSVDIPSLGWDHYLKKTTEIFGGSMICDCYRPQIFGAAKHIYENRYYRSPHGEIAATYYQYFGISSASGKDNLTDAKVYSSLAEAQQNTWRYNYEELARFQISNLSPPPTLIIFNQKYWIDPCRKGMYLQPMIPSIMRAFLPISDVVWLQPPPAKTEVTNEEVWSTTYSLENYMQHVMCNSSHRDSVTVMVNGKKRGCLYVPFSRALFQEMSSRPEDYYADGYHLRNNTIYHAMIHSAIQAAHSYNNVKSFPHQNPSFRLL
jgi:hypothetical protein